ncbi:TetR/AcrR family transcriptional regulator [Nocardia sp. NPDC057663]|uniref:TetR/AcrR family transcriptional regulator n=1 Tax=Nocardia sp. NPDC057663 TaxID=3346201 RepID=UPI00366E613F
MTVRERRERERAGRHRLIVDTARELAESQGWGAVTARRLAEAIEYSQPVLYSHFAGMEAIVQAVALQGFTELADTLAGVRARGGSPGRQLRDIAHAYVEFGVCQPALYDAMFVRVTEIAFGSPQTPEPLVRAFAELRGVIEELPGERDPEVDTEVFWSAVHGLVSLARSRRIRTDEHGQPLDVLLNRLSRMWALRGS